MARSTVKKFEFPETVAACEKGSDDNWSNNWRIGDALIREVGPPSTLGNLDGSYAKMERAYKEVISNGSDYALRTLRRFREMSQIFPPDRRRREISYSVHVEAGSPEMLDTVIAGWPEGKPLTSDEVRDFVEYLRTQRHKANVAKYERRYNEAKDKVDSATTRYNTAKDAERQARDLESRRRAKEEAAEAQRDLEEAEKERDAAPKMPKINEINKEDLVPESPTLVGSTLFTLQLHQKASQARRLANEALEMVEQLSGYLDPDLYTAIVEDMTLATEGWRKVDQITRSKVGFTSKNSHLTVVGE